MDDFFGGKMATRKVGCIKDLSGVTQAMGSSGDTGVLSFVGQQAYITTVASDANAVITLVDGVATAVTPIADDTHDVGSGATVTTVNGVITAKTAPTTPVAAQTWTVAVGDVVVIGEGGVIESITPA